MNGIRNRGVVFIKSEPLNKFTQCALYSHSLSLSFSQSLSICCEILLFVFTGDRWRHRQRHRLIRL